MRAFVGHRWVWLALAALAAGCSGAQPQTAPVVQPGDAAAVDAPVAPVDGRAGDARIEDAFAGGSSDAPEGDARRREPDGPDAGAGRDDARVSADAAADRAVVDAPGADRAIVDAPAFADASADRAADQALPDAPVDRAAPDVAAPDARPEAGRDAPPPSDAADVPPASCTGKITFSGVTVRSPDHLAALQGIECINGDLTIEGPGLSDLEGLERLIIVTGTVKIAATELTDASLPSLVRVGGWVTIGPTPKLARLSLPALARVDGFFQVIGAPLTAFDLTALADTGQGLRFERMSGDISLTLPALRTAPFLILTGNEGLRAFFAPLLVAVSDDLRVTTNTALTTFEAPALTTVGRRITFDVNLQLPAIALPALTGPDLNDIAITHNRVLVSVDLPALEGTKGSINIYSNDKLARVAFPSLRQAPALTVTDNPELVSLDLNQVETISATIADAKLPAGPGLASIKEARQLKLDKLQTTQPLRWPALTKVDSLNLSNLGPGVTSVEAPLLDTVTDSLDLQGLEGLSTLAGLAGLRRVGGDVRLQKLPVLRDLAALRQLNVLGDLWLVDLPALASLADLGMLTHVDVMRLDNLEALSDLRGLDALADVRGLTIAGNGQLASLAGLGALVSAQESLTVKYNVALADASLPRLASVKVLTYEGNAPAATLSLPALRTCGSLEVVGNSTLATLTLPVLASANAAFGEMLKVTIEGNEVLRTVSFPSWSVDQAQALVSVARNPALTRVACPAFSWLTALAVTGNPVLTELELPDVVHVTKDLTLTGNTSFPTCAALALRDRVLLSTTGMPPKITISDTNDASTCP